MNLEIFIMDITSRQGSFTSNRRRKRRYLREYNSTLCNNIHYGNLLIIRHKQFLISHKILINDRRGISTEIY